MKGFLVVAVVLCLLCIAQAIPIHKGTKPLSLKEDNYTKAIEDFIVGFASGMEIDITGANITSCVSDGVLTYENFDNGWLEIEQGFKDKSLSELDSGFKLIGLGLQDVAADLKACDITDLVEDIAKIASQLSEGPEGIVTFVIDESVSIWRHHVDLTADLKNGIAAWKAKDFLTSGTDFGEVIGVIIQE